jgi:hypothetical protein
MTLYDLIADMRREHPSEATSKTLDLVMIELGHTRDNLREAVRRVDAQSLPAGGAEVVRELEERARRNRLDNLQSQPVQMRGFRPPLEPVDDGMAGVAVLLGLTSVVLLGLAAIAVLAGLNRIFHWV